MMDSKGFFFLFFFFASFLASMRHRYHQCVDYGIELNRSRLASVLSTVEPRYFELAQVKRNTVRNSESSK